MDRKAANQLEDVKRGPRGVCYVSGSEWSVQFAAFISSFDRFATTPMLLVLAASTGMTFAEAVKLFSIYLLFYALGQPIWGLVSDRFGRLIVLRSALVGGLIGGIGSMLFASFIPLMVARGWTGLMVGALYPTLMVTVILTIAATWSHSQWRTYQKAPAGRP